MKIWLSLLLALATSAQAQDAVDTAPADEAAAPARDFYARDTFRIETIVCPFKGEIEYEPGEIECGLLQVPENREVADSRYIELHFAKISATEEEDKRADPIIYLTGGPGVHATAYIKRLKDHGVVKHRDLYILEQRGIGRSGEFCPFYSLRKPEVADARTFEEQLEAGLTAARDCAANAAAAGVDLSAYSTIENARDVRVLRQALGFDQWNVWGISYGSILGQAVLKTDGEGVRAIALDAIVPISVSSDVSHLRVVKWYDRDLAKLTELCAADEDCAEHYGDFAERLLGAIEAVREQPIVVSVEDTERFPSGEATIFHDLITFLPFSTLYEQEGYGGVPGLIYGLADAVERRDELLFKALAAYELPIDISQGMYNAIYCLDGWAEPNIDAVRQDLEEFPILASSLGSVEWQERAAQLCRDAGTAPRDRAEYAPVETDVPALIIDGDMDPITPPPLAQAILPGFSNATYVEFPYAGHGPSRSVECAGDMLTAFYDAPADPPDLSCVEEMEPPQFVAPVFWTSAPVRALVISQDDEKAMLGPAAWAGSSALVLAIAFLVLTFAPLARRLDRRRAAPSHGARLLAWATALVGTAAAVTFGLAFKFTFDTLEALLLVGLVSWARFAAYGALLAGILGLALIWRTIVARRAGGVQITTMIGFVLTGLAAVSLSVFLVYWDLGPF